MREDGKPPAVLILLAIPLAFVAFPLTFMISVIELSYLLEDWIDRRAAKFWEKR